MPTKDELEAQVEQLAAQLEAEQAAHAKTKEHLSHEAASHNLTMAELSEEKAAHAVTKADLDSRVQGVVMHTEPTGSLKVAPEDKIVAVRGDEEREFTRDTWEAIAADRQGWKEKVEKPADLK